MTRNFEQIKKLGQELAWDERNDIAERTIDRGVENGIDWMIVRAPLYGAVNGYVEIPQGHPWHGKDYDELDDKVKVHGGLTFSDGAWIGFDTMHAGDLWPESPEWMRGVSAQPWDHHWDVDQVREEVKHLARQVAAAS